MGVISSWSRYPVVEIINSLSTKTVIPVLDKIFSLFGCPVMLKSSSRNSVFQKHQNKFATNDNEIG